MTYQVLARKWRPRSFKEMAGQSHVLKTLINSLENNRLHHAYLFTGTRGVGKTSIARILARCLNCEVGVSSEPCGECSACREIDEGRFIDLIEVDAASRTKVEDTREMLDNVQYAPSRGRFKVYLIDEVHMLSGHSFNALLKTLEEPPPHVKFLLATTDPQKLPVTVLSRCLQFSLKNLSPERIMEHLKFILEQEQISFEETALWQLGRAAQGSVRDALTLLDQAISFSDGQITENEVSSFLGTIDQVIIHKLVDALNAADGASLLDIINESAEHGTDFSAVLEELLSYLHRVSIAQIVPNGVDNSQGDKKRVLAHAQEMTAENLQLFYQIALKGREELPLSLDDRSGLEMTLLRMLAFTPKGVPSKPQVPLPSANSTGVSDGNSSSEASPHEVNEAEKKKTLVEPEPESTLVEMAPVDESTQAFLKEPVVSESITVADTTPVVSQPPVVTQPISEPSPQYHASSDVTLDRDSKINFEQLSQDDWINVFYGLELSGITRNIVANCVLQSKSDEEITLLLSEGQSVMYNEEHKKRIGVALNDYFGQPLRLTIEFGEIKRETPAGFRDRKEIERLNLAVNNFSNDDNVQEIVNRFSGRVQTETIEPLTPKDY